MASPSRKAFRAIVWLAAALVAVILCLLRWGDNLLVTSESAPSHVDAAIVLQGSMVAEKVRIGGAVSLWQQGVSDQVLVSVPTESYWGQQVAPAARAFIERNYPGDAAAHVNFCETSADVNSTIEEAEAILPCIQQHQWRSVAIVTSDYHTRRAGILWRRILRKENSETQLWIVGVADPEFQRPWWRHRQSAKIWLMESLKLVWSLLGLD